MNLTVRHPLAVVLAAVFIAACATPYHPLPLPDFDAQPIDPGRYEKKVGQLVFVLDASSSMADVHRGYQKLDIARGVINNFNDTMPDLDMDVTLRSFGHADSVSSASSTTMLPTQAYSRDALTSAVARVKEAGGISPLARALADAAADLKGADAPIAMVIVSDGRNMASGALTAAGALRAEHGERLCIYALQVGDAADGTELLSQIAAVSGCGEAVNADGLGSGQAMQVFVQKVLLTAKNDSDGDGVTDDNDRCPGTPRNIQVDMHGCPLDSDKDGVSDYKDACPDTPEGTTVDAKGCPVVTTSAEVTAAGTYLYKDIQFENNKAELRESSFPSLNEVAAALNAQPGLKVEIHGHTDGSGARAYNQDLSQRRAESVKAYLESNGIDASRMTAIGFGPDRPIDSNATKEGRARNRRVEFKPVRQ